MGCVMSTVHEPGPRMATSPSLLSADPHAQYDFKAAQPTAAAEPEVRSNRSLDGFAETKDEVLVEALPRAAEALGRDELLVEALGGDGDEAVAERTRARDRDEERTPVATVAPVLIVEDGVSSTCCSCGAA